MTSLVTIITPDHNHGDWIKLKGKFFCFFFCCFVLLFFFFYFIASNRFYASIQKTHSGVGAYLTNNQSSKVGQGKVKGW
jgi:hypothetical protein